MRPDGSTAFCCEILPPLTVGGQPGHITRDAFDALWNAPEIVDVRATMARGGKPASCRTCWNREAEGGISRRILMNAGYRDFLGHAIEKLPDVGASTGYRLERHPDHVVLEMGNVCNLKCRSCCGICSSRIAADAVHAAWNGADTPRADEIRVNGKRWYDDVDALATMLEACAQNDMALTLMGGEPFLIPAVWKLLSALVERGVAGRIYVGLSSNGQQTHPKLAELVPQFRGFNVSVSVDGYGKLYEYLRHGGSWRSLERTLDALAAIPNLALCVVPTLQNVNALDLVDLLRFLDRRRIRVMYNIVNNPARLAHTCLPAGVRRVAERRLRAYLDRECKPENLDVVRAFCHALEPGNDDFDPELFAEFMEFTNDLDAARGESLREAAPELWSLLRAAGVEWSNARRHVPHAVEPSMSPAELLERVNRTVSPNDLIFPGFEAAAKDAYFTSAAQHVADIDALLRASGEAGLHDAVAVADVGSHYGRITRALRAALPSAAVYACDIDAHAVRFCADELGALPVAIGWDPETDALPAGLDAIVCFSLLTHTTLRHWRGSLRAWARMLRPGGVAAFTYLADRRLSAWRAGEMAHYGDYPDDARAEVERAVAETGFGFAPLTSGYGGQPFYGITFVTPETVAREIEAAGLEIVALPPDMPSFGQELALVRKPRATVAAPAPLAAVARDVAVVALYDPSDYAAADGEAGADRWTRLLEAEHPALPTELGFTDARVADVREAQAALAAEHGIDAFCYRYRWDGGPRSDAPLRELVQSGRPAFGFGVLLDIADPERFSVADARRLFAELIPALRDPRYLRIDDVPLVLVREPARLAEPRVCAAAWRLAARDAGLGDVHLCGVDARAGERPDDRGFDSFVMAAPADGEYARRAAHGMAERWPDYRAFRMVRSPSANDAAEAVEAYEFWLQSAVDVTRRRGEKLVFLDAWNDWRGGAYLEPDDRTGRALLGATRRAVRGPASGLVLMRRLRDALASNGSAHDALLDEFEAVVKAHERSRERLFSLVEAALARGPIAGDDVLNRLPVRTSHLPTSPGRVLIDYLDGVGGVTLHRGAEVHLHGDDAAIVGWAHTGDCPPEHVDLFVAFESEAADDDAIFRVPERHARADVGRQWAGFPEQIGFRAQLPLREVKPGRYRVTIVQRTPDACYRDVSTVIAVREDTRCSSG